LEIRLISFMERKMKSMKQIRIGLSALASVLALGLSGGAFAEEVTLPGTASTPISAGGVTPYIIDGANPGGNRTCEEVGLAFFGDKEHYRCESSRSDYESGGFLHSFGDITGNDGCGINQITVDVTEGTYVRFVSTTGVGAAIVKGSDDANVYAYDPQVISDSGLASPPNASGNPAGLSNLTFCWNPDAPVPPESEWCSPGYWRQEHHLDSWLATGILPEASFSEIFGDNPPLSRLCERAGITGEPTLWQVLQSPQCYGGDAFNAVGDLLSAAHPDVDFTGERVEDNCPLN
jgi:hypothetical protein